MAATLNYTSLDRSDVQHAAKEICTKMANQTLGSWKRLKKACRHLRRVEMVTWVMLAWKHDGMTVDVHVDTDWAKRLQRKSTSGGKIMVNGTHDRGGGDVAGGGLDVLSMSSGIEKSDAVRHRCEHVVTKELVAHGARGHEEGRAGGAGGRSGA